MVYNVKYTYSSVILSLTHGTALILLYIRKYMKSSFILSLTPEDDVPRRALKEGCGGSAAAGREECIVNCRPATS